MLGFMMWLMLACFFIGLGIYAFLSKKEVAFGFWSNVKAFPVENVKAYNHAVGKLWCVFGIITAILGLPLLGDQNSPAFIVSILGLMAEAIAAMTIYVTVIEKKYRKK